MNFKKFAEGDYLETEAGSIFLRAIGSGPPLIVIHGGPGLDHTYLLSLTQIAKNRTLLFYDQPGCGEDKTDLSSVNAELVVDQLISLVKTINSDGNFGFLTHSWGSYVALAFLEKSNIKLHPSFVILANPCPLNRVKYDEVGERLLKRIPSDVMSKIGEVLASSDSDKGSKMMSLALPYYCGSDKNLPSLSFHYSEEAYNAVTQSLGNFHLTRAIDFLPQSTLLVYAERDYIQPGDTVELQSRATKIENLKDAGHFAFAEQPDKFNNLILSFLIDVTS